MFGLDIEGVLQDRELLDRVSRFIVRYSYQAAAKEESRKIIKANQKQAYMIHWTRERDNNFKGMIDCLTISDIAWTFWNYVNCYDDWKFKAENPQVRYGSKTRFTTSGKVRAQPTAGSEGRNLYETYLEWFEGWKKSANNWDLLRRACNKISKEEGLIPTYTEFRGPQDMVQVLGGNDEGMNMPPLLPFDEFDDHVIDDGQYDNEIELNEEHHRNGAGAGVRRGNEEQVLERGRVEGV